MISVLFVSSARDTMKDRITAKEKYDPAMRVSTQEEADTYFEQLVQHTMRMVPCERELAEWIERQNLGYWAGYGSLETRERVERLFRCRHPILPAADQPQLSQAQLLQLGFDRARARHYI